MQRARENGQHGLFGGGSSHGSPHAAPGSSAGSRRMAGARTSRSRIFHARLLHFRPSARQICRATAGSEGGGACDSGRPAQWRGHRRSRGSSCSTRPMRSRRGARWAILTLQDRTGVIEALVFPEAFQKLEGILKAATPLLVKGRVAVEDVGHASDRFRCAACSIRWREPPPPSLLRVRLDHSALDAGIIDRLQQLFSSRPGRCRVAFELVHERWQLKRRLKRRSAVRADKELVDRVREICGSEFRSGDAVERILCERKAQTGAQAFASDARTWRSSASCQAEAAGWAEHEHPFSGQPASRLSKAARPAKTLAMRLE